MMLTPSPKSNRVDVAPAETVAFSLQPGPAMPVPPSGPTQAVALIVCHGMGQQVRHETLAEAADNLHHDKAKKAIVSYVRFVDTDYPAKSDRLLPRAEIEIEIAVAGQPSQRQKVHVYEVYWAPLTEGQIGLMEVIRFLAASGGQSLLHAAKSFPRWLFGREVQLPVDRGTFWKLFGLLVLILALVLINTILTLVVSENLLQTDAVRHTPPELVNRLTGYLTVLLGAGMVLAGVISVCNRYKRRPGPRAVATVVVWAMLFGTGLLLIAAAGCMSWAYLTLHHAGPEVASSREHHWLSWRTVWVGGVWAAAVAVSWWCRGFLVQYLGDVAIYVDAYKVDKYFAIRTRIRKVAQQTIEAIYGARQQGAPTQFQYQRVVLAGHSLGSLVAYDALNALLVTDEAVGGGLRVQARTQALVTYGSPLDKTTFLFHAKTRKTAIYTALDSSRQPLVWDASVRQTNAVQWVNLYAGADIISGPLNYFDQPDTGQVRPPEVLNYADSDAFTPVYAHTQYWNGPLLSNTLRLALAGHLVTVAQLKRYDKS